MKKPRLAQAAAEVRAREDRRAVLKAELQVLDDCSKEDKQAEDEFSSNFDFYEERRLADRICLSIQNNPIAVVEIMRGLGYLDLLVEKEDGK